MILNTIPRQHRTVKRFRVMWKSISTTRYDEMLGMLPPAHHVHDGFLFGEVYRHTADGTPQYTAFRRTPDGRCFESCTPLSHSEFNQGAKPK